MTFSLYPAPWIANRIIEFCFGTTSSRYGSPSISCSLRLPLYNQSPTLLDCLHHGDISGLKRLFARGEARPTDLLAPWGDSLLHVAVYNSLSTDSTSMELCNFLIEQGADPNSCNINGSTPLHLCCGLMGLTNDLELQLQPIAGLLTRAGTDLTLSNSKGYSVCSLIFHSQEGLPFLQNFVFNYVDIFTLQQMQGVDLWILAALARAFPQFERCLQAQLSNYQYPLEISAPPAQHLDFVIELDVPSQIEEVKSASSEARQSFLNLLCAKGTLDMMAPFLTCALDLDEHDAADDQTYIRAAAKNGKVDIVSALVKAGASLDTYLPWMSMDEILPASSAVDDFLERWYSIRVGNKEYTGTPETEHWILRDLLSNSTFKPGDSIFFAMHRHESPFMYRCLLEAGCGRRDGKPAVTRAQKALGSEVIWAIKCNNPIAALLIEHGLGIECEDRIGFSALLHALDRGRGRIDFCSMLIEAGADLTRRTASGFTPLELAKHNLHAQHPRYPRRDGIIKDWELRAVSLQEDHEAYERMKEAIRERYPSSHSARFNNVSLHEAVSRASDIQSGLAADWRHFKQTVLTADAPLACLGFILTVSIYIFLTTCESTWWVVKYRKTKSLYEFVILIFTITCGFAWIASRLAGLG